ncbi:NADPH-dependent FMN reductase [Zobellia sp. B3R18]|uniref:NADPH-dependent FMN reductase n=1 Tax=Zobellia sp. B3R18 TaxID=2841568 RepID=UPI001C07C338|nr:NAD(P)H-dependent oxidoreductase [Zobellia sp. B3R18]MBU2973245.1 NAD(P)H-dependent oxidoreductase [Zobellia sp. B3R18]
MKKVITMAGSNSQKSINKKLLSYTSGLLENTKIISIDLNDYVLPIYGVDYEEENGIPTAVRRLNELMDEADGFMISLAEHNGSYTAVLKNTIDWLSRVNIKIWREKPLLLLATSPGGRGGKTVLESAKAYFPFLGAKVIADFSLPNFYDNFKEKKVVAGNFKKEVEKKSIEFYNQL